MSNLSRRSLLGGALAGGALAAASGLLPRLARASAPFTAALSNTHQYRILEVFLEGGADLWGHLYRVPDWVDRATRINPGLSTVAYTPPNDQWHPLFASVTNQAWIPSSPTESFDFGWDGANKLVQWGPAMKPLWPHRNRASMVAVSHGFPFHEGATHLALTGTGLGRSIAASLGAAVNRARPPGEAPVAFVISTNEAFVSPAALPASIATGFHGAANQPLAVSCGNTRLYSQLDRDTPAVGTTVAGSAGDALRNHYDSRYRRMLFRSGSRVRSRGYDAYEGSLGTLTQHAGLQQRLQGVSFALPTTPTIVDSPVATAIRAAKGLLANGAAHVTVMDTGWDAHDNATNFPDCEAYARNNTVRIYQVAHALAEVIAADPTFLNTTLVFVHSEFGRRWEGNAGGGHNPDGYPVLLLGGPIPWGWPRLVGHFTCPTAGGAPMADGAYGVAAVRAAVALAAGINPWHEDVYAQSHEWLGSELESFSSPSGGNSSVLEESILGM